MAAKDATPASLLAEGGRLLYFSQLLGASYFFSSLGCIFLFNVFLCNVGTHFCVIDVNKTCVYQKEVTEPHESQEAP